MPAATAAAFAGIHNENEFYSHHYLSEIFSGDIRATVDRWRRQADAESGRTPYAARALAGDYVAVPPRLRPRAPHHTAADPATRVGSGSSCPPSATRGPPPTIRSTTGDAVPALCAAGGRAGAPALLAFGAYDAEAEGEDPLRLRPHPLQFHAEAPPPEALLRAVLKRCPSRRAGRGA